MQHVEIRIRLVYAAKDSGPQRIVFIDKEIDRQSNRNIAAHRGIKRYEHAFRCIEKAGPAHDDAIDDRLAVFAFADLEIRRFLRCLDEISLAIYVEQSLALAADLSADNERDIRFHLALLEVRTIAPSDLAQCVTHELRHLIHRCRRQYRAVAIATAPLQLQQVDDALRYR